MWCSSIFRSPQKWSRVINSVLLQSAASFKNIARGLPVSQHSSLNTQLDDDKVMRVLGRKKDQIIFFLSEGRPGFLGNRLWRGVFPCVMAAENCLFSTSKEPSWGGLGFFSGCPQDLCRCFREDKPQDLSCGVWMKYVDSMIVFMKKNNLVQH